MLSDVITVTCQKSGHSGYCALIAYYPGNIGTIVAGETRFSPVNITINSPSIRGTLLDQWVFGSLVGAMSACYPRPFP